MMWWKDWRIMLPISLAIVGLAWWAFEEHVDTAVIAGGVIVAGLVTNAFAWLMGLIAFVPVLGPAVVKLLTLGFLLLVNAVGSVVSFVAIKRGYAKEVLTTRGLTIAVIIGIVIGYILGKLI